MKREPIGSLFVALFLSFLIAMSGLGCLVTAFCISGTDWVRIILWCAGLSLASAAFFFFRWGGLIYSALLLAALNILLRQTDLLLSAEALIHRISRLYNNGYGWGYIRWSQEDLTFVSMDSALICLGCLVICAVTWTLLRKKWLGFGLLGGLTPLLLCCILLDTVPHRLPLLILICSLFVLTLSHRARKFNSAHGNALTVRLIVPALLFCSLIFVAAPTVSYEEPAKFLQQTALDFINDLKNPGDVTGVGNGNGSGGSSTGTVTAEDLDLSEIGPLHLGKQRIMIVSVAYQGKLYLRSRAYDTYTGTNWQANAHTQNEGGWPTISDAASQLPGGNNITIYTIATENFCYVPYYIRSNDWTQSLQSGILANPHGQQQYSFPFLSVTGTTNYLSLSADEESLYLSLPADTLAAADAICVQLLSGYDKEFTTSAKAQMIADFVKGSALYDLDTAAMPASETDFAIWFLEEGETGYCVHFASAATVLLRAAGIPARYVSGYMTTAAKSGNTTITADQAHAWVEYLDPDRGWTILEVTPGMDDEENEETVPTGPTDPTQTEPTEATDPTETDPTEATTEPTETDPTEVTEPTETTPSGIEPSGITFDWNSAWVKAVLQILLICAILAGQYRLRLNLRKRWLTRGEPNRQAVHRWEYIRRLARLTRKRPPRQLHQLTEKAVFSQHTLTGDELSQYDAWIREAHCQLLNKPWPVKLLLQLLLAIK